MKQSQKFQDIYYRKPFAKGIQGKIVIGRMKLTSNVVSLNRCDIQKDILPKLSLIVSEAIMQYLHLYKYATAIFDTPDTNFENSYV